MLLVAGFCYFFKQFESWSGMQLSSLASVGPYRLASELCQGGSRAAFGLWLIQPHCEGGCPSKDSTQYPVNQEDFPYGLWEHKIFPSLYELWQLFCLLISRDSCLVLLAQFLSHRYRPVLSGRLKGPSVDPGALLSVHPHPLTLCLIHSSYLGLPDLLPLLPGDGWV